VFRFRIRIGSGIKRFTASNPDPDIGWPKVSHKVGKNEEISCLKSLKVLEGVYKTFMTVFDPRNAVMWIRDPGSGRGFF
jgi:hypothetical protein